MERFQQTEIGKFPHDWKITRIDDAFSFQQGKSLSAKERTGEFLKPFLRTANVFWNRIDVAKVDEMDVPPKDRERLALQFADVLVCEGGDIGRTAIWRGELGECYYQNHLHRLRPKNENTNPFYFALWMQAAYQTLNLYGGLGIRTTIPNLSSGRLKEFLFPLPPLGEQTKIAAVLSKVWNSVEAQIPIIGNLRELKKSTMNRLFTHGLRGESLKKTEIGMMPKSWRAVTIEEIISLCQYGTSQRCTGQGLFPVLRINSLIGGQIDISDLKFNDFKDEEFAKYELHRGDLLFNRTNSIDLVGKTAIFDLEFQCAFSSYLIRLRVNDDNDPFYVNYYLNWETTQKRVKGLAGRAVGQANISGTRIKSFVIPLPPKKEQSEIVGILKTLDEKIAIHEAKKSALEDLFKAMLNKLMTGTIRVKDLDLDTSKV